MCFSVNTTVVYFECVLSLTLGLDNYNHHFVTQSLVSWMQRYKAPSQNIYIFFSYLGLHRWHSLAYLIFLHSSHAKPP